MVFLNESGVNTGLIRRYGRASSSQRAVNHTLLNTPQTTTALFSIRLNGEKVFTAYQGRTTRGHFVQYLKETLLPTLRTGDIAAMDNMRSHHVKAARDTLEAKGKMAFKKDFTSRIFQGTSCFARIFCLSTSIKSNLRPNSTSGRRGRRKIRMLSRLLNQRVPKGSRHAGKLPGTMPNQIDLPGQRPVHIQPHRYNTVNI